MKFRENHIRKIGKIIVKRKDHSSKVAPPGSGIFINSF